jgi:3-oxoacyl-[acyl-carrier-protein] synthase II
MNVLLIAHQSRCKLTFVGFKMTVSHHRRVVVSGIGAVTPLGGTFVDTWQRLCQGRSGVVSLTEALAHMDNTEQDLAILQSLSCQVAAPVQHSYTTTSAKNASRVVHFALAAAAEAVQSAGLVDYWGTKTAEGPFDPSTSNNDFSRRRQRSGVSIGTGMSGVRDIVQAVRLMDCGSQRRISPYFVPTILGNAASARVAMHYGVRGPNVSAATACAAGSHALGDAARYIQSGLADIMLAGGAEACIDPLSLIGFSRLRALSTKYNDMPASASRPFDKHRDGFVMGEGACVVVLEEFEHAQERWQGKIPSLGRTETEKEEPHWIEFCGYGATADAHHITAPDPHGIGAIEAMQQAMREAARTSDDDTLRIDYVNAHATSTPVGDEIEARAIVKAVRQSAEAGEHRHPLFVSSTKGATGHLLGAAGAIEAAFTIQSLRDQVIPTTLNLEEIWDGSSGNEAASGGLVYVQGTDAMPCEHDLNVAMSNSFGFGGTNSSLIFRRIRIP